MTTFYKLRYNSTFQFTPAAWVEVTRGNHTVEYPLTDEQIAELQSFCERCYIANHAEALKVLHPGKADDNA